MVLLNVMTTFYLSTFAVNYRVYTVIIAIKDMKPCEINYFAQVSHTVNSEIITRVLFSRNFACEVS